MAEILLSTINARYIHAAFGLRYLHANLGDLAPRATILEFESTADPRDVAERLLAVEPTILGLGVYIWNVEKTTQVVSIIKRVRPSVIIVLGGPEVSFDTESQPIVAEADYVVCGEGDLVFRELCTELLAGRAPTEKVIRAKTPDVNAITFPYDLYTDEDLRHRVVYVEASRGCPFTCEFCLSSINIPVRQFDVDAFLAQMDRLYKRGLRTFKFVDRTFNLNLRFATHILEFFLARMEPGLFVHFEMVPDRFPAALRALVARFPAGSIQFEVGIQSFNPEVGVLISRRQDIPKILDNLTFLREQTGVHIHADLIAGLPGENIESFGRGFDTLLGCNPHEIQIGILKRLKGTPIARHDVEWEMKYAQHPPFEVVQTRCMDFHTLQRMQRFAKFWDLISNSGNFPDARSLVWEGAHSPFWAFIECSDWLHTKLGRSNQVSLKSLTGLLFEFLVTVRGFAAERVGPILIEDYCRPGRTDIPVQLRGFKTEIEVARIAHASKLKRQNRHLQGAAEVA